MNRKEGDHHHGGCMLFDTARLARRCNTVRSAANACSPHVNGLPVAREAAQGEARTREDNILSKLSEDIDVKRDVISGQRCCLPGGNWRIVSSLKLCESLSPWSAQQTNFQDDRG